MKKQKDDLQGDEVVSDMVPEYDLKGKPRVRGKYSQAHHDGHAVRVHQPDGSITVQYFTLEDGAVMLEPEVRAYFPDSESVNRALRSLIDLIPPKPARRAAGTRKGTRRLTF